MKATFNNAIDALLEDNACVVPCTLVFGGQRYIDCANCQSGIYTPGGPLPFPHGRVCPICLGKKIQVEDSEVISLMCIFDTKKFRSMTGVNEKNVQAETFSHLTLVPKLQACKHIILDSDNKLYMRNEYKRAGAPEPCGFGDMRYIIVPWTRVK